MALPLLAIAVIACSRNPAPESAAVPAASSAEGATDWFGPGVTAVRREGTLLRLQLLRPASVAALRIFGEGTIVVLGTRELPAGTHWYEVPPKLGRTRASPAGPSAVASAPMLREGCHAFEGRQGVVSEPGKAPPPLAPGPACARIVGVPSENTVNAARSGAESARRRIELPDHILLVVSDSTVTAAQLEERLQAVRDFAFETVAHDLPEFLVGRRTPMWAGYLVRR